MSEKIENVTRELAEISGLAREKFGGLSNEQLNWKPAENSWSVAQCLDHLIKSNEMFYPEVKKIGDGTRTNSLWENWSPLTGWSGRFLIKSLQNDKQKTKTAASASPPSTIEPGIVEKFVAHQNEVAESVRLTENADWEKTILTSPFLSVFTYKLADGYQIMLVHEHRHLRQAERVMQVDGFPV